MTGHPGERRNRTVALVTEDFRLYHRLVPFLESHGLKVVVLRPGDDVPATVRALLGGQPEDQRSVPLLAHPEATLLAAFSRLDPRLPAAAPAVYRRVVVGVDPGKIIGLGVLADGDPLLVGECLSVADALDRVAAWATGIHAAEVRVHVGSGAAAVGLQLLKGFRERLPEARVARVPEDSTTPWSHVTSSRHTDAALHIAMRQP